MFKIKVLSNSGWVIKSGEFHSREEAEEWIQNNRSSICSYKIIKI